MKLLHIITALNVGGAETMLAKLLERPFPSNYFIQQEVLSLVTPGPMADRVRAGGIKVHSLGMREGVPSITAFVRLAQTVRAVRPDLILGWMHHGHLATTMAAFLTRPRPPVVWNVCHSMDDIGNEKLLTRGVLRLCAMFSGVPEGIVYSSRVAVSQYAGIGYRRDRAIAIPDGFECERFRPRDDARDVLLRTFGIEGQPIVVGMAARAHPMKDPEMLVEAVRRARLQGHDIHLLIVGQGMDDMSSGPGRAAAALPPDRVTLAGHRSDLAHWLAGLDILALPSAWGEAFPNVLGEAMLSGVPCVTTDVGDSALIVGETGHVVPPRDPQAMADAFGTLVKMGAAARRALGLRARARIIENFSTAEVATRFARLCDEVIARRAAQDMRGPSATEALRLHASKVSLSSGTEGGKR